MNYVYQYKDHLGNVRLSYTDNNNDGVITPSTEIIEESNYYPFGLKHKGYNGNVSSLGNSLAQKWGYNGKELNEELGIQWHDFGARNYDAALGRWFVIDPLADAKGQIHNSTYNYALNNPVVRTDPDGKCPPGVDCLPAPVSSELAGTGGDVNTFVNRSGSSINVTTSVTVGNTTKSSNIAISLGRNVKQGHVTDKSATVIASNLDASGNSGAKVTSGYRDPKNQARVMYNNIKSKGVASQKKLYGSSGDKVIDVYSDAKKVNQVIGLLNEAFDLGIKPLSDADVKSAMTDKINQVGPGKVSKHSSNPNVYNVIDISPRSLSNGKAFGNSVKNDSRVKKVITPPKDPAYHIEIPQN